MSNSAPASPFSPIGMTGTASSSKQPILSLIVPCLNEEQNIPTLLEKLDAVIRSHHLSAEILIVDDCSDDYTFREAFIYENRYANVRALHKGLPRGIGRAIRYRIDHAKGKVGVVVMGDCVDPLTAIPDFVTKIVDEGYHLVLLSRYIDPSDSDTIPLSYRFYQWGYRILTRLLLGIQQRDLTYAFRGFDLAYVRRLRLESNGFEISPELSLKSLLARGKVCELRGRQGRRIAGESKFLFSAQGKGYARVMLQAFLFRWTGRWGKLSRRSLTKSPSMTVGA